MTGFAFSHKGLQSGKAASSSRTAFHDFSRAAGSFQLPCSSEECPSPEPLAPTRLPRALSDRSQSLNTSLPGPRDALRGHHAAASLLKGQGPFCPGAAQAAGAGGDWEPPQPATLTGQGQLTVCPLSVTAPAQTPWQFLPEEHEEQ